MLRAFRGLIADERGTVAIEYVLIASLISVAAIVAFTVVGTSVSADMTNASSKM